jgi:CBS domain-containing protein
VIPDEHCCRENRTLSAKEIGPKEGIQMATIRLLIELKKARVKKREVIWVSPDDMVSEARHKMVENNVRSVLVMSAPGEELLFEGLAGILTAWDCVVSLEQGWLGPSTYVREIMTPAPIEIVTPDTTLQEAVVRFEKHRHLPVVDGGKIVDVISDMDLLYALQTFQWSLEDTARGAMMSPT